ncbi:hypothetical protein J2T09_002358 [Neorhizobium huautlense]|uniref:Uncharacterized protein n=1 Tax=Neorhizobium huautlense TaxID=67774 RepID=A0ABT9PTX1_9HYPH|nr:hypothetical protein [Neorhizobium huautlense]MDP9837606.1 hypothetical protein [Neorhizobium huautlense]
MVVTFPRELPNVGYVTADFTLDDGVRASPSGARLINYTQVADPTWRASLVTRSLVYSQFAEFEAWWMSLRGGLRSVLFRHPHVCFPKNHGSNQAPANDPGNLVSVSSGNILSVNGVDVGLSLVIGDRVGLENSGRYYVGRISEVSGSGEARSIAVEPPPFAAVSGVGTVVRFARPALLMRPVPGSWSMQQSSGRYTASFQLVEGR